MGLRDKFFLRNTIWLSILVFGEMGIIHGLISAGLSMTWASIAGMSVACALLFLRDKAIAIAALASFIGTHFPLEAQQGDAIQMAIGAAFLGLLTFKIAGPEVPFLQQRNKLAVGMYLGLSPVIAGVSMALLTSGRPLLSLVSSIVLLGLHALLAIRLERELR